MYACYPIILSCWAYDNFSLGQVNDDLLEDPFDNFRIGQTVTARIVAKTNYSDKNKKSFQWDLSLKPTLLTGKVISGIFFPELVSLFFLSSVV